MSNKRRQSGSLSAAAAPVALALVATFAAPAGHAAEVAGVQLADSIELAGVPLHLNGAGARTLYIVRTYVAALYVAHPSAQANALFGQSGPRRLSLTMLAALSTEWLVEHVIAAMRANMSEDAFAELQPRLARLLEPFLSLDRLRKGDRLDIDTIGEATQLSVGGRVLGAGVAGDDLFDALLRAFIGERPIDTALGRALLGGPASAAERDR